MAIAAAVTAANLYYCQPLLSQIARSLHMTARETADIPMLTQVGYALGLLFFAPLIWSSGADSRWVCCWS
jgi:predicted MFS family arabinose efflux permease